MGIRVRGTMLDSASEAHLLRAPNTAAKAEPEAKAKVAWSPGRPVRRRGAAEPARCSAVRPPALRRSGLGRIQGQRGVSAGRAPSRRAQQHAPRTGSPRLPACRSDGTSSLLGSLSILYRHPGSFRDLQIATGVRNAVILRDKVSWFQLG